MLIKDLVQESQPIDASMLLQQFKFELMQRNCHTGCLIVSAGDPTCCPSFNGVLSFVYMWVPHNVVLRLML